MAIAAGMTCAITNPLEETLRKTILAADVMMGNDENCAAWLNANRESGGEGIVDARQRRRSKREELRDRS
jgi:5-methyltetrahydrofolate--homocysteine methyltransferase